MKYKVRTAQYEDGKVSDWSPWVAVESTHDSNIFAEHVKVSSLLLADLLVEGMWRALVEIRDPAAVPPLPNPDPEE